MEDIVPSKYCTKCKELKNITMFFIDRSRQDGRSVQCKECKKLPPLHSNKARKEGVPDGYKLCIYCGEVKALDNFYKSASASDGHAGRCKVCYDAKVHEWVENINYTEVEEKKCFTCGKVKSAKSFSRKRASNDGYNSSCRSCTTAYNRSRHSSDLYSLHKQRENNLKNGYNLTFTEYDAIFQSQSGVCACCGREETAFSRVANSFQRLSVDHCHRTNKIRGLLCSNCNTALGLMHEDPANVKSLLTYIEKWKDIDQ